MCLHQWDSSLPAQALPLRFLFSPHYTGVLPLLWRYSSCEVNANIKQFHAALTGLHTEHTLILLSGCLYEGRERANGETWNSGSDPCATCVCREGSVHCARTHCPPTNCHYPVQRQCCMSCDGEWKTFSENVSVTEGNTRTLLSTNLSLIFYLQAACLRVRNIQTALSFATTTTPVACVPVMEGRSPAAKYLVMEIAATLTKHLDNVVANVNVCKVEIKLWSHF